MAKNPADTRLEELVKVLDFLNKATPEEIKEIELRIKIVKTLKR